MRAMTEGEPVLVQAVVVAPEVMRVIRDQKLWREMWGEGKIPEGRVLVVDFGSGASGEVELPSWRARKGGGGKGGRIVAAVVTTPSLREEGARGIRGEVEGVADCLGKGGRLFVWERRGEDFREDWRVAVLKEAGLVKVEVLTGEKVATGVVIWRGRLPKERQVKEVNLLEEGPKGRRRWVDGLLREVCEEYLRAGYRVVGSGVIMERLRASRFPFDDLGRLRLGWGVTLEPSCGCGRCSWEVDLAGGEVLHQGESWCNGEPVLPEVRKGAGGEKESDQRDWRERRLSEHERVKGQSAYPGLGELGDGEVRRGLQKMVREGRRALKEGENEAGES